MVRREGRVHLSQLPDQTQHRMGQEELSEWEGSDKPCEWEKLTP